jgi:hypothetical protein
VLGIVAVIAISGCGSNKNPECRNAISHVYSMGCEFEMKVEGLTFRDASESEALKYCDTDFAACFCVEAYESFVSCMQMVEWQQCASCNIMLTQLQTCQTENGCAVDPPLLGCKVAD